MRDLLRSPIRASAFVTKEVVEVLRQPRLVLTLVLGPFLILLLFGVGFRNQPRTLRALYVASPDNPLRARIAEFATSLGPDLLYMGVIGSEAEAREQLRRNQVDLVVVAPEQVEETIRSNSQAAFTVYHNEIDPVQADYLNFVGQFYVAELNRQVLRNMVAAGQEKSGAWQDSLAAARNSAGELHQALDAGNAAEAQAHQQELDSSLNDLTLAVGTAAGLLGGVEESVGGSQGGSDSEDAILEQLALLREENGQLAEVEPGREDYSEESQVAGSIEDDLADLETMLGDFRSIDAAVIVNPFRSDVSGIAAVQPRAIDFFAPVVLALLLQHLAVTFAALSVVRERALGAVELFRVSPLSSGEALIGKYLSFMFFGGLLAVLLTLLLRYALGVPMLGSWLHYALVLAALLFTSLGFGFVISLISQTDSQAVQYAMLLLLGSVFFGGFFIALYLFWPPVRVAAWAFPVTYGTQMLQSIMLRGLPPGPQLLGGLTLLGVGLFLLAWLLLARLMARR